MNLHELERQIPYLKIFISLLSICALTTVFLLPYFPSLSTPASATLEINPNFHIPAVPHELPYQHKATVVLTWIMSLLGLTGLLITLPDAWKRKTPVPVLLALSGTAIAIPETFYDVIGCVLYPFSDKNNAFTLIGRQMPWFIVAGWFGFSAPFLYMLYANFRKGVSAKRIWAIFLLAAILSVPIEEILLYFDVYYYYGNQPLILFHEHPFWWAPCNAGGLVLAAALVYRLENFLSGWRALAILFITPMAVTAFYGMIAMPAWIVVNADYSWLITQAGGLLTVLMGCIGISLVIHFVIEADRVIDS